MKKFLGILIFVFLIIENAFAQCKKKGFVKSPPTSKVVKFHMGDTKKEFKNSRNMLGDAIIGEL